MFLSWIAGTNMQFINEKILAELQTFKLDLDPNTFTFNPREIPKPTSRL